MRERTIVCEYYICKGQCKKNKDAEFLKTCQHCGLYRKKEGVAPYRVDNRKKKMEKILKKENF